MAKRDVQFQMDFNIDGLNTIESLENELDRINEQIKNVDANSDAFKELSQQAQAADGKLRTINTQLEGVSSVEKAEGIRKMGDGLVGAFQIGAGASLVFGEKTSEQLEKVIAKVGGLYAALDGVTKITEALSAQNLKFAKAAITGFKKSGTAAKLFGSTTKKALIATGIGAFIVLIGTLIANWDKIKKAGTAAMDAIKESTSGVLAPFRFLIGIIQDIMDKVGDLQNLFAGLGSFIKSVFTFDGGGLDGAIAAFEETVELEKELDALRADYNEKITETQDAYERENELLELQGDKQQEILDRERERNQEIVDLLKKLEERNALSDEQEESLKAARFELEKIAIRQDKLNKSNAEALKVERKKTAEAERQKAIKEAEQALREAELQRQNLLKSINLEIFEIQKSINELLTDESLKLSDIDSLIESMVGLRQDEIDKIEQTSEAMNRVLGSDQIRLKSLENYIGKLDDLTNKAAQIKPPTEDSIELVKILQATTNEYAKQRDILQKVDDFIASYTDSESDNQGIVLSLSQEEKQRLITLENQKALLEEQNKLRKIELTELEQKATLTISTNKEYEKELLALGQQYEKLQQNNEEKIRGLEADMENAESKEEYLLLEQNLLDAKQKALEIEKEIRANAIEIENVAKSTLVATDNISRAEAEREKIGENIVALQNEQSKIIGENADVYLNSFQKIRALTKKFFENDLPDWFDKNKEYIYASQELLMMQFEISNNLRQAEFEDKMMKMDLELQKQKEVLDEENEYRQELLDKLEERKEELADTEEELNDLLMDAEGDRYDDILESLQAVRAEESANAEEQKRIEKEKELAKYKYALAEWEREKAYAKGQEEQAKAEKTQAIIMATIQTALSIIEALPNIAMAAIVGVLGAVGIATIASQSVPKVPVPQKPKPPEGLAEGGYTPKGGKYEEAGVVHKGEYVVPQDVLRTDSGAAMASVLEEMRLTNRGFADGGATTAMPTIDQAGDSFDYERLTNSFIQGLKQNPMFVSVTEFRDVENRLSVVEDRSSI